MVFCGARQYGADAHEKQKLYYDRRARYHTYREGELVWLHKPTEDRLKLAPHWKGPYMVLAVLDSQEEQGLIYRIGSPLDLHGPEQVVHYDRLKPYTLLQPAGASGSLPASPHQAPPEDDRVEEPHVTIGTETALVTGNGEPQQTMTRSNRVVRQPAYLGDFVTYR